MGVGGAEWWRGRGEAVPRLRSGSHFRNTFRRKKPAPPGDAGAGLVSGLRVKLCRALLPGRHAYGPRRFRTMELAGHQDLLEDLVPFDRSVQVRGIGADGLATRQVQGALVLVGFVSLRKAESAFWGLRVGRCGDRMGTHCSGSDAASGTDTGATGGSGRRFGAHLFKWV